jgi:hypothetical protein
MKQFIFSLVFAISGIFNTANANETFTTPQAVAAFEKQFSAAREATWEDFGSVYKVSFWQNGRFTSAFYDAEGEMVSINRNISMTELPAALKKATTKQLNSAWMSELVYVISKEEKAYYATFETADNKIIMKSVNNRKWIVFKVIEK